MKVAALDLGSNTFLCLIAEVEDGRIIHVLDDQVRMVRLGQDVAKTGRFHPDALKRAEAALSEFSKIIESHQPDRVLAMATSAARDAANKDELFALGVKYKIPIEIIPGGREAEITFSGSISGLQRPLETQFLVIDVGGGSTEFIFGRRDQHPQGQSLDLGCVRMKEKFAGLSIESLRETIADQLRSLKIKPNEGTGSASTAMEVIAVAGTPTELARMEIGVFDPVRIEGYRLSRVQLDKWAQILFPMSPEEIHKSYGVSPGRADVLIYGVLILSEALKHCSVSTLTVSVRGVRYGVALEIK